MNDALQHGGSIFRAESPKGNPPSFFDKWRLAHGKQA
jgi:hypothetical protein